VLEADGLGGFVALRDEEVRRARLDGVPAMILGVTERAADAIEARVGPVHDRLTAAERVALVVAKRLMFNAASDCWPGWGGDAAAASEAELERALKLATRSAGLVEALALGAMQEGAAAWLLGALELALGQTGDALNSFSQAVRRYRDVPAPGMVLLCEGYIALACAAGRRVLPEGVSEFEQVLDALAAGRFEDDAALRAQLLTARRQLLQ
jgi:hypothetical protein